METQPRSLNTLYKLLWEQIKDRSVKNPLWVYILEMRDDNILSEKEKQSLILHISKKWNFVKSKQEFVKRMIKETENE